MGGSRSSRHVDIDVVCCFPLAATNEEFALSSVRLHLIGSGLFVGPPLLLLLLPGCFSGMQRHCILKGCKRFAPNATAQCLRPFQLLVRGPAGIVDDAGQPCPSGTVGHIALANPAPSTPGYFGNPAATALLLRHGRLITGDLGYLDGDGVPQVHLRTLLSATLGLRNRIWFVNTCL